VQVHVGLFTISVLSDVEKPMGRSSNSPDDDDPCSLFDRLCPLVREAFSQPFRSGRRVGSNREFPDVPRVDLRKYSMMISISEPHLTDCQRHQLAPPIFSSGAGDAAIASR